MNGAARALLGCLLALAALSAFARAWGDTEVIANQEVQARYREHQADALYRQGEGRGSNAALVKAIVPYHDLLEARTRERVPLDWAATQNNLGAALRSLGEHLGRAPLLAEALKAVRNRAIYAGDGMRQHDDYFTAGTRIEELEGAIAAMQGSPEPRLLSGDYGRWRGYRVSAYELGRAQTSSDEEYIEQHYRLDGDDRETVVLRAGDPPEAFLADCRSSGLAEWACLARLILCGMFLSDNRYTDGEPAGYARRLLSEAEERQIGGSYLSAAARQLESQLVSANKANKEVSVGGEAMADLDRVLDTLDFYHYVDNAPPEARADLARYFLALWRSLPSMPMDRGTFILKLHADEWLKEYFFVFQSTSLGNVWQLEWQLGPAQLEPALAFFREAFVFHQQMLPSGTQDAELPSPKLSLVRDIKTRAMAYSQRRDREGLWPVQDLPLTDIVAMKAIVTVMAEQGIINAKQAEEHRAAIKHESLRLQSQEVRYWIDQAERSQDRKALASDLTELAGLERDMGRYEEAKEHLTRAVTLLAALDAKEWAARSVDLASYKLEFRDWAGALDTVRGVLPLLKSMQAFGLIKDASRWEQAALKALGRETEAVEVLKQHEADLEAETRTFSMTAEAIKELGQLTDGARKIEHLKTQLNGLDPSSYMAAVYTDVLIGLLQAQGSLDEAAAVARRARFAIRRWFGQVKEHELLGELLVIEKERGEFAAFLEVLTDYETVGRAIAGENWKTPREHVLARVYYALGSYDQAMEALQAKKRRDRDAFIRDPFLRLRVRASSDQVLEARILLATGDRQRATELIDYLTADALHWTSPGGMIVDVDYAKIGRASLLEIAEIETGLDRKQRALAILEELLKRTKLPEDLNVWVEATIRADELRLALGQPPHASVEQFERLAADIREFPQLGAVNAIRLGGHLARLKRWTGDLSAAQRYLEGALDLAHELGAVEEEIALHRFLGEITDEADNWFGAVQHYQASALLVSSISERIPEDTSKVGYREQRARAIPLLALLHYRLHRDRTGHGHDEAMLAAVELGKNRALAEVLHDRGMLPQHVDVPGLRRVLAADEALVEYYTPEGVSDKVFRFYLHEKCFEVTELPLRAPEMEDRIRSLLKMVTRDRDFDAARFRSEATDLAHLLLPAPLLSDGPGSPRRVYIVPTGALYLFPPGLLVDREGLYLDERETLSITYLPSASFLLRDPGKEGLHGRTGAYINPALDRDHYDLLTEVPELRAKLESALRETGEATLYWQERRTPKDLLKEAAEFDNVLLYTHARFLPDRPMESYIRLAGNSDESPKLTALALAGARLREGLWTLAACETGSGRVRSGDEVMGLPRALLLAGASRIVISLWSVDAVKSLSLVTDLYRLQGEGHPTADALRIARGHLRLAGHPPFVWAPFILVGPH